MGGAFVLVVDDEPALRDLLSRNLARAGYVVEAVGDLRSALDLVRSRDVAVLVTDIIMPYGDGVELIAAVKRSHPDVRIVAISGRGSLRGLDLLDLATKIGADAALAKPFTTKQLLAVIEGLPSKQSGRRVL
jgi:DNA-binding NtrC family response regulator